MAARQRWEVVGGGDKGGILVRGGQATSSEQLPERLATGAIVEELELAGERLQYEKVSGAGPQTGWVSIALKDKELLIRAATPAAPAAAAASGAVAAAGGDAAAVADAPAFKEGDYYVTLGVVYKKTGADPTSEKIMKLNRKVGHIVHTTGKVWKSPKGGFWVELDTSGGDSGAGEKPGYVMIDASGFGTPGPCLQKVFEDDGPPLLLQAATPEGMKPWDGSAASEKEFLVLGKSSVGDVKLIISMLFGATQEGIVISAPPGRKGGKFTDATTVAEMGFESGESVSFEVKGGRPMALVVMSPLEAGEKLCDLAIKDDWTVEQVRTLLCKITGLRKNSMLMAKGKMGTRVGEDAQLPMDKLVVDCGYSDGDEIAFIYMGDPAVDLEKFLASK